MSALALKKGAKPDQARTKKLLIGCVGVLVLGYAGSSVLASSATSKKPPKLTASIGSPGAGTVAPGAAPATPGATVAPAASTTGSLVPVTTPWVASARNPFVTVPAEG